MVNSLPFPKATLRASMRPMQFDQAFRKGQTDSQTTVVAIAVRFNPCEHTEDLREHLG